MKLQTSAHELLSELYERYQNTGSLDGQLTYSDIPLEKKAQIQNVEQLVTAGLVVETASACGFTVIRLTRLGIDYFEKESQPQAQVINFNVSGNIENSILGNQASATIHVGADIEQLKSLIDGIAGADRDVLSTLPTTVSDIQKSGQIKRGALAKFSEVLTKYPKIIDAIGGILAKLALGLLP